MIISCLLLCMIFTLPACGQAELVKLQIAAFENVTSFLLTDAVPEMIRKIKSPGISVISISIDKNKNRLNIELRTIHPVMTAKSRDGIFVVNICKEPEKEKNL